MRSKWFAPILPYFAVWAGLFVFKNAWVTLIGFHLAILIALAFLRSSLRVDVFFKPAKLRHIALSVILSASSGLGLYLLWNIFGIVADFPARLAVLGLNSSTWVVFILYFSLVNPFIEEYFWRGNLGSDTRRLYLGDVVYAGYHLMIVWDKARMWSVLVIFFVLISAGWLWRQLYRRDGSLLAPVLGHIAGDLSILLAVFYMTR